MGNYKQFSIQRPNSKNTAAFTYYYGPVFLQNKLTPLLIFRDLALGKRYSNILCFTSMCFISRIIIFKKVYPFMKFLNHGVACVNFGTKIS